MDSNLASVNQIRTCKTVLWRAQQHAPSGNYLLNIHKQLPTCVSLLNYLKILSWKKILSYNSITLPLTQHL